MKSFESFCEYVRQKVVDGYNIVYMSRLKDEFLKRVRAIDNEDASNYKTFRLKKRLQDRFPQLVFHKPRRRFTSEIVYAEDMNQGSSNIGADRAFFRAPQGYRRAPQGYRRAPQASIGRRKGTAGRRKPPQGASRVPQGAASLHRAPQASTGRRKGTAGRRKGTAGRRKPPQGAALISMRERRALIGRKAYVHPVTYAIPVL